MKKEHDFFCDYEVTPRGYIADADYPSLNVPIYQTDGVSDGDAVTATEKIKAGYVNLDGTCKNTLQSAKNFLKIEIVSGNEDSFDPETGIVKIALETEITIKQIFQFVVIPKLIQG